MTEGTRVQVKPLRHARWLPGEVLRVEGESVTVVTNERLSAKVCAHRFYTVPVERVRTA